MIDQKVSMFLKLFVLAQLLPDSYLNLTPHNNNNKKIKRCRYVYTELKKFQRIDLYLFDESHLLVEFLIQKKKLAYHYVI